jgi:ABC-type lipoprotein release transport system permease subunit
MRDERLLASQSLIWHADAADVETADHPAECDERAVVRDDRLVRAQRHHEVGIRLALGAHPRAVKRMFVYRGMTLSAVDAATFAAAAGVLVVAALAASYIPARRAAAVDPVETLRGQ